MEGFGYKNWDREDDDSYDTSTPPTYTSENYGFGAASKKRMPSMSSADDMYNFDYDQDVGPTKTRYQGDSMRGSGDNLSRHSHTRRMSKADREKQILDGLRRDKPAKDDNEVFTSFQDNWNDLMQDLESVPGSLSPATEPRVGSPLTPGTLVSESFGSPKRSPRLNEKTSPFFSPTGSESFEISAADLEVGSIAARRSKEKALERRRGRQSFDPDHMPPQMSPQTSPRMGSSVMSPDMGRLSPRFKSSTQGVQESTALSSIDKADAVKIAGTDSRLYGGVDKSDGELFRKLTENRMRGGPAETRHSKSVSFDQADKTAPLLPPENARSFSDEGTWSKNSAADGDVGSKLSGTSTDSKPDPDESAEYSDEFDEDPSSYELPKKSSGLNIKTDLTAPIQVTDSVEGAIIKTATANAAAAAAAENRASPTPVLSSKEIERRKSVAEIQQRWFTPSPPVAPSPPNVAPAVVPATTGGEPTEPGSLASPAVVKVSDQPQLDRSPSTDSPHAMPFSSEAPCVLSSKNMVRPSPLVTSSLKDFPPAAPPEEQVEKSLGPSTSGSFVGKPTAGSPFERSESGGQPGDGDVTMESGHSGVSDPPSPPSSAAPSAAASVDMQSLPAATETDAPPPALSSSVSGLFRKVSVDAEDPTVGHKNDLMSSKTRVSFDLNKNVKYIVPESDGEARKSIGMSVDSLEYSTPNLAEERAILQRRENSVPTAVHVQHQDSNEVGFRSDFENYMVAQNRNSSNNRYSSGVMESPPRGPTYSSNQYDDPRGSVDIRSSNNSSRGYAAPTASSVASLRSSGGNGMSSARGPTKKAPPIPLTLDVVVPSIDELHAQLAMIKAAEKRRREHRVDRSKERGTWEVSKSTERKAKHRAAGSVSTGNVIASTDPSQSRARPNAKNRERSRSRSPPPPPVTVAAPEWDSLSRLEQSNSRLNRQFEDLSEEIKLLRNSTTTTTTPPRAPSRRRSLEDGTADAPRIEGGIAGNHSWKHEVPGGKRASGCAPQPSGQTHQRSALDSWDADALSAVKDILRESDDLRKKEKTLHERERVLDIRENLINQAAQAKTKEKSSAPGNEKDTLNEEIVALKSQLFQAQQHIFQLHSAAKAVVEGEGLDSGDGPSAPAWDSTHYFELTCTYLTRLGRDPRIAQKPFMSQLHGSKAKKQDDSADVVQDGGSGGDGLGGKWINEVYFIPHTVYLKLQRDKLASESILEASQKENERLMGVLKSLEKDVKSKDATYFDQQSEMVKEINKLKNQLQSFSGAALSNFESGTAGDELLSGYHNSGIGGLGNRMGADSTTGTKGGRKAFEAEAIIWRLQEQVAEAESRAADRENKLQQTIGRLTLENENLLRSTGGKMSESRASGSFIPKSEAHKTYFSSNLVGASAGWNDEDPLPPPPPPDEGSPSRQQEKQGYSNIRNNRDQPSAHDMEVAELQLALSNERRQHEDEVELLRSRLKWFAETQQTINTLSEERDNLAEQLKQYQDSPTKSSKHGNSDASCSSMGLYRRHPSDTKKIKELEATVMDLREALQKRFPDSISNLLYAASAAGIGADPAELDRARSEVSHMKEELENNAKESDRKLRGLRQEFEKMRVIYEDRIRNLESFEAQYGDSGGTLKGKSTSTASVAAVARRAANNALEFKGKPWSSNKLNPAKNLSQALARIRELELGESRLRSFYTRKIEDMQRRYETQIHALKRNGTVPAMGGTIYQGAQRTMPEGNDSLNDTEGNDTSVNTISDTTGSDMAIPVAEARLSLLQSELLKTAEELGRAKKTISSLETALKSQNGRGEPSLIVVGEAGMSPPSTNDSTTDTEKINARVRQQDQQIAMLQQQIQEYQNISQAGVLQSSMNQNVQSHLESTIKQKDEQLADLRERSETLQRRLDETTDALHKETLGQVTARSEWADIQKRLIEKIEALQNENMNQRDQMRALQATPEMHNFLALEGHLNSLEEKLSRRDQELQQTLEGGKKAMQLERIRLQAFHEQELREKDEQLKVFQIELEQLISAMRAQDREGNKSIPASDAVTAYQ